MDKKRPIIGSAILAVGIAWTVNGVIQLDVSGDVFTDNTVGLGIVTMVMSAFIFKKMYGFKRKEK